MRYLLVLFISCLPIFSIASETIVQGTFENFNGKTIRVAIVEDYITNSRKYLTESTVENNQYRLSFEIQESRQIILKLEDKETTFFAEVGAIYNINLSYDEERNRGQAFNKTLDLHFAYPKTKELNQIIRAFNNDYQDFMADNYRLFITQQASKAVEKFIEQQNSITLYQENDYAKEYVRYALANLKHINHTARKKLLNEYLQDQDILYLQKEYMNFFMQLYQKSFESMSISRSGAEVLKAIVLEEDLKKTLKLIKENEGFNNTELAELYLIYGLYNVYYLDILNKRDNLNMLNQLAEKAKSAENRALAKSVIEKLRSYNKGEIAANFELKNSKDEIKTLEDFKGKVIYLNFWADWSIPSLKELNVIKMLETKYGEKIHFISINLDEDPEKMKNIQKKNNYPWTFLHYGNDYKIRENYNVSTVPTYFLIDKNSKILEANTLDPTEIEWRLYELSK